MSHKKITKLVVEPQTESIPRACSSMTLTPNFNYVKKCMNCTLDIQGAVVGCPTRLIVEYKDVKHNEKNGVDEYMTYGVFCSLNCAKSYAIAKEDSDQLFAHSCRYIEMIARKEKGSVVNVIPSPPIDLMIVYGGYMSEEQYRSELGKIQYIPNGTTITHPLTLVYLRK